MERFKVFSFDTRETLLLANSLFDCVRFGKKEAAQDFPRELWVECRVDDLEVPMSEILDAWNDGERPEDLQFF